MNIGVMYRREWAPEGIPAFATETEAAGFDELWLVEDLSWWGGMAPSGMALAVTSNLKVGLGLMPAPVRNPVYAAMNVAVLARTYPGRYIPAFGHGVGSWMRDVGAMPQSQLAALEDVTVVNKRLLNGERFDYDGKYIQLKDVHLVHPPAEVPPIYLGVTGPNSLALSGRVADGTIIPEFCGVEYIEWAKAQIDAEPHSIILYLLCVVDDDAEKAFDALRPFAAETLPGVRQQITPLGIADDIAAMAEAGEVNVPNEWMQRFAAVGTPADCAAMIQRIAAAGVDSVVLVPPGDFGPEVLHDYTEKVLPLLR